MSAIAHEIRELAQRSVDGLVITLSWDSDAREVLLTVEDDRHPLCGFTTPVPADEALFAFEHPFLFEPLV